jgi:hypothetical protein
LTREIQTLTTELHNRLLDGRRGERLAGGVMERDATRDLVVESPRGLAREGP